MSESARFDEAMRVFDRACDLPPTEREAFLAEACGDDASLRREVLSLLQHDQSEAWFDDLEGGGAVQALANSVHEETRPTHPEHIGPYRIVDKIGEGGMGVVYLAEQTAPVARRVALKVCKSGHDSASVLRRFDKERQALAVMSDDAIARVFDAGSTESGQPYFVMEYIEGVEIDRYCDEQRLSIEERLRLFARVCDGVQHAHQRGVIHRDLKPGNILVSRQGQRSVPKIIDFGLVRATQRESLQTLLTEQGMIFGTPEFMSPEQATGNPDDVDTRSDVYSLGVVLYQLLSGELPFSSDELRNAGPVGIQRMLRAEEPLKPSSRFSSKAAESGEHAASRRTSMRGLYKCLQGDLDWITMKALEKDPELRYQSPRELAADIERYLAHEAVLAGPPSTMYRVRRFVRRYTTQVVAAGLVLLSLIAGIVVALSQASVAEANAVEAQRREYEARISATIMALQSGDVNAASRQLEQIQTQEPHWELRHLRSRLDQSLATWPLTLREGPFQVSLAFDPAARYLFAHESAELGSSVARGDELAQLTTHRFDVESRCELRPIRFGPCLSVGMSVGRELVYVIDEPGHLQVLSPMAGERVAEVELPAAAARPNRLTGSATHALAVSSDSVHRIDLRQASASHRLAVPFTSAALFATDLGARWGAAIEDSTVRVWDLARPRSPWTIPTSHAEPRVVFGPAGTRIAVQGGHSRRVELWSLSPDQPPEPEPSISVEAHRVVCMAFSPEGSQMAMGTAAGVVSLWSLEPREKLEQFAGGSMIMQIGFAPGAGLVASLDKDSVVRVWAAGDLSVVDHERRADYSFPAFVYAVCYGGSGERFYSGSWGQGVRIFDAATGLPIGQLAATTGAHMDAIAVHPDETLVAVSQQGRGLQVFDLRTGVEVAALNAELAVPSFSPCGKQLAAQAEDGLRIWSTDDWSLVVARPDLPRGVPLRRSISYSLDGRWLAVATDDVVALLDASTAAPVTTLSVGRAWNVAFDPTSRELAMCSDGLIRLWSLDRREIRAELRVDYEPVDAVWGAQGRLFVAGYEGLLHVHDTLTGSEVARLAGHTDYVNSVALDPAGERVITGSGDTTVRVWETAPLADRYHARRQYEVIASRLRDRVADLVGTVGTVEAIRVLAADPALSPREREIAAQLCVRRALRR
ncbi:MAG: serine/threonine-protein kinase [Planctomycetota bacterium]